MCVCVCIYLFNIDHLYVLIPEAAVEIVGNSLEKSERVREKEKKKENERENER